MTMGLIFTSHYVAAHAPVVNNWPHYDNAVNFLPLTV